MRVAGASEEYEEIGLSDIVRVLQRRRLVLAVTLVLALATGGAVTMLATPQYEAKASVIPLAHQDIVNSWLASRQAAEVASDSVGKRLFTVLFPREWDSVTETWTGSPPTREAIGLALHEHVAVNSAKGLASAGLMLVVTVTLPDALLARDVAAAYIASLTDLRPQLENITRSELFDEYYDGTNGQEAQRRAETAAAQRTYWIVFDSPTVPDAPSSPRPVLNMALAAVLGLMGGVFVVFGLEWLSKYRAEFSRVEPPQR